HGRAAPYDRALRSLPRPFEGDGNLLDVFIFFLQLLRFFFLVLLLVLAGVRRLRTGVLLLAFLLFVFLRWLERNGAQRLAKQARSDGPCDRFSVVGPVEIIRAD